MSNVRGFPTLGERMDAARPADWRRLLATRGDHGGIIGDERNVLTALRTAPELCGLVRFNQFALAVEFAKSPPWRTVKVGETWTDFDDTALTEWLQGNELPVNKGGLIANCIELVAQERGVHPVREYLKALVWDGRPRIGTWLEAYLGATEAEAYLAAVGPKWLISAVARILQPGAQVDHVLVLEGDQGIGKSQTARALARKPSWFTDEIPDMHTKDAAIQLCGRWIIELAELAALRKAEIEAVKAFITRTADVFRPPYGRRTITVPRQCVFIATTNESRYLRDQTGNRRFWPVSCGLIDIEALKRDCDQLWAEAVAAYGQGTAWHLLGDQAALAETEQRERVLVSELETDVAVYLDAERAAGITQTDVKSVMVRALKLDPEDPGFAERSLRLGALVASAMERAGWRKVGRRGHGDSRRTVYRYQE